MSPIDTVPRPGRPAILALQLILLTSALISLAIMYWLPTELRHFNERAIGIGILKSVDPSYRNNIYILSVVAGLAVVTALSLRLRVVAGTLQESSFNAELLLLACLLVNLVVAGLGEFSSLFMRTASLTLILLGLLLALRVFRPGHSERHKVLLVTVAWQAITTSFLLYGSQPGVVACLFALLIVTAALALSPLDFDQPASGKFGANRILQALASSALAGPILYLLANEGSHLLSGHNIALAPVQLFSVAMVAIAIVFYWTRSATVPSVHFAALCTLIATISLNEYSSTIFYRSYDLFHLGESLVPLQQFASFGRLPFIDYMLVHGLFDVLPQGLYYWLSGSELQESPVWGSGYFFGWLMRSVAVALLYLFLARLLTPIAAFFLIWLLPSYHLVEPYNTLLLLPAIHLLYLPDFSRGHTRWWLLQWLLTAGLVLWRPDFGLAAVAANLVLAGLISWRGKNWQSAVQSSTAGLLVFGLIFALYLSLAGPAVAVEKLRQMMSYLSHQIPVVSYVQLYEAFDYSALMQYWVLPALTVVCAGYSASRILLRSGNNREQLLDLLIVFLAALTLIIAMRSLHRHSLMEGLFKPYFFVLVPLVFAIRHGGYLPKRWLIPAVVVLIMGSYVLLPASKSPMMRAGYRHDPMWEYPNLDSARKYPQWDAPAPRLNDRVKKYDDFVSLMQQALGGQQTFFEFVNGPLLYALVDVQMPVFVMQTIYLSTETIQLETVRQLEQWRLRDGLPFVIFRQNNAWDKTDGVDSALRSYHVAEYIYGHYTPCVRVSKLDIWIDRRINTEPTCKSFLVDEFTLDKALDRRLEPLNPDYLEQQIAFGHLPRYWAALGEVKEIPGPSLELSSAPATADNRVFLGPRTYPNPCHGAACYLDVTLDSDAEQIIEVEASGEVQASFVASEGLHAYRLRISSLWHWYSAETLEGVALNGRPGSFQVVAASLVPLQ